MPRGFSVAKHAAHDRYQVCAVNHYCLVALSQEQQPYCAVRKSVALETGCQYDFVALRVYRK